MYSPQLHTLSTRFPLLLLLLSGAVLELSGVSVAAWLPSTRSTVHPDRNRPSAIDTARVKAVIFFN